MALTAQEQGKYFKTIGTLAARVADDKKGEDIKLLHIHPVSSIADYLLIVSVTSPAHMGAIEESVRTRLKTDGQHMGHRDGRKSDVWRVLDYGGLLIHLMHPKARAFYALDKLFHDAKSVTWMLKPAPRKIHTKPVKKKSKSKTKAKKKIKAKTKKVAKKKSQKAVRKKTAKKARS